jgi:hypothetical protein
MIECTDNLSTGDCRESLNSIKISVLNRHDSARSKDGLGQVVNELTVDEDVASMGNNLFAFESHLVLKTKVS